MKRLALLVSAIMLLAGLAVSALAHTGPLVGDPLEPAWAELDFSVLDPVNATHVEPVLQTDPHKGWWFVNLTNRTGSAWSGVTIKTGVGDLVAIVQGNNLVDEWDITGNSVTSTKAGTAAYSGSLGSRNYGGGVTGTLWKQVAFTFTTPVAIGQKAGFKVYTDNSYYTGPYADSFQLTITPNAVPEPISIMLGIMGLGSVAGFKRLRRK